MTSGRLQMVNTTGSDCGYENLDPQSYTAHRLVCASEKTGSFADDCPTSRNMPLPSIFI